MRTPILFILLLPISLLSAPLRALVTGGAGFLGSHLCERLIADGYEVICLDNLYTGRLTNIAHLLELPGFQFIQHDVCDPLPDNIGDIAEIYNMACPASPLHYQRNAIKTILTNVIGTQHVLDLARQQGAKFFQASTSEIYGDPLEHPQKETYWGHVNPIGIRACYDEGKRCAETLCFDYNRQHNVRIKVGRIFNTFGPRMSPNDGRVVSNFILQALTGQSITIYGNGNQTRSFCYVNDLIEAIVRFMKTPDNITGPLNLGNPSEWTMLELASKVIRFTESNSSLIFAPLPQDDPKMRLPDIALATNLLHWEPNYSIDKGLINTIEYFKTYIAVLRSPMYLNQVAYQN